MQETLDCHRLHPDCGPPRYEHVISLHTIDFLTNLSFGQLQTGRRWVDTRISNA